MDNTKLRDFAAKYTAAWCSQSPASVAEPCTIARRVSPDEIVREAPANDLWLLWVREQVGMLE